MTKKKDITTQPDIHAIGYDLPQVYSLDDIYDPERHDGEEGYFIPAVDALVVETIKGTTTRRLYSVFSVDPITKKSILVPISLVDVVTNETRVLGYGNETCMLYYDDRVSKTRLVIDAKISLYGGSAAEYKLIRISKTGERIPISLYIDSHGTVQGVLVPIIDTGVPGIKKCLNCNTLYPMVPGENIILEIYSAAGLMLTEINLISRKSLILTDFTKEANPITGFTATANQTDGSNWALYTGQNVTALTVWPKLIFNDGTELMVPIDSKSCFIYGLEDIKTNIAGLSYKVMLKYFLSDNLVSEIEGSSIDRFLIYEQIVKILAREAHDYAKVSFIPKWNVAKAEWELTYIAYYTDRVDYEIIPSGKIRYTGDHFDGKFLGEWQRMNIAIEVTLEDGSVAEYTQKFAIRLEDRNTAMPYLIANNPNAAYIYGRDYDEFRRPYIYYDITSEEYFISSNIFETKAEFLKNFYIESAPPYNYSTEEAPPVPTHFTIRDSTNGRVLISDVIEVEKYNALMHFLTNGPADKYVGETVLVEFLKKVSSQFEILYSVPVVVESKTHR